MFKFLLLLLSALLLCGPAIAVIDANENVIGVYFDQDADSDCLESVSMNSQIPCYIVLTNPTFSDLYGFELGFDYGDGLIHLGTTLAISESINVGSGENLIVGFGTPTTTQTATLLATLDMLYIDATNSPTTMSLHGSSPSTLDSAYPAVLLSGSEVLSMAVHNPEFRYQMNGACSYVATNAAWDEVKSLYR